MDLTGRFPTRSISGNEYILVCYHYDSNAILVEALKNRQAQTITDAWIKISKRLSLVGAAPNKWVLDNEISQTLKDAFEESNTTFQLVPPHNHRANKSEHAIQTFKQHFKAGLASVDPNFPVASLWDLLLQQA